MICTRSLWAATALALALAGCGAEREMPRGDWRAMLAAGDGIAAEQALERALRKGEPKAGVAPYMGEAHLLQGDLRAAREWLEPALFAPAEAARGFHMLGRLRVREGNLPAAGRAFDRAMAEGRGRYDRAAELWVDIARLRYSGGEQAQAIEASRRALALGPRDPSALLLHAQLVRDAQGNEAALPLFEQGLASAPGHPDLLADYAATLGELGRADAMLAAVGKLVEAAPGDQRAAYLQAVLAARAGNHDLARGLLQRGNNLDRRMPAAALLLALVDLDNGNPASAAQALDRLLRDQPDNQRLRALMARALALSGNQRELIARFGGRADTRYLALLVGRAHEALGQRDKAAPFLDRAFAPPGSPRIVALPPATSLAASLARASEDNSAALAAARGLVAAQRAGEARRPARQALARFPGSAEARALAGDVALATGDARAALRYYRAAAAIRRPWPLTKRMAVALERLGNVRAADALVAAHFAGEPNNAEAAQLLSRRAAAAGDRERAKILARYARVRGG